MSVQSNREFVKAVHAPSIHIGDPGYAWTKEAKRRLLDAEAENERLRQERDEIDLAFIEWRQRAYEVCPELLGAVAREERSEDIGRGEA